MTMTYISIFWQFSKYSGWLVLIGMHCVVKIAWKKQKFTTLILMTINNLSSSWVNSEMILLVKHFYYIFSITHPWVIKNWLHLSSLLTRTIKAKKLFSSRYLNSWKVLSFWRLVNSKVSKFVSEYVIFSNLKATETSANFLLEFPFFLPVLVK